MKRCALSLLVLFFTSSLFADGQESDRGLSEKDCATLARFLAKIKNNNDRAEAIRILLRTAALNRQVVELQYYDLQSSQWTQREMSAEEIKKLVQERVNVSFGKYEYSIEDFFIPGELDPHMDTETAALFFQLREKITYPQAYTLAPWRQSPNERLAEGLVSLDPEDLLNLREKNSQAYHTLIYEIKKIVPAHLSTESPTLQKNDTSLEQIGIEMDVRAALLKIYLVLKDDRIHPDRLLPAENPSAHESFQNSSTPRRSDLEDARWQALSAEQAFSELKKHLLLINVDTQDLGPEGSRERKRQYIQALKHRDTWSLLFYLKKHPAHYEEARNWLVAHAKDKVRGLVARGSLRESFEFYSRLFDDPLLMPDRVWENL